MADTGGSEFGAVLAANDRFLVSIEADRPGAWFPGPSGPYQAWFSGIQLSRDFELVKVPGNPMKVGLFWCLLGGQIHKKKYLRA
jgi:hypothetical protein